MKKLCVCQNGFSHFSKNIVFKVKYDDIRGYSRSLPILIHLFYLQYPPCSECWPRLEHPRTISNFRTSCEFQKFQTKDFLRWSFKINNFRHQIQHYTNQLAKDTSKQLRDLNDFPHEQSLDPRYSHRYSYHLQCCGSGSDQIVRIGVRPKKCHKTKNLSCKLNRYIFFIYIFYNIW